MEEDFFDKPTKTRTQSQKLRAVIYRLWEKQGKKGSAEEFYRDYMEKLIVWLRQKLD